MIGFYSSNWDLSVIVGVYVFLPSIWTFSFLTCWCLVINCFVDSIFLLLEYTFSLIERITNYKKIVHNPLNLQKERQPLFPWRGKDLLYDCGKGRWNDWSLSTIIFKMKVRFSSLIIVLKDKALMSWIFFVRDDFL